MSAVIHHRAGEWESIWGVRACLIPKVFSRHLLQAIARERIWLELNLHSDLEWLFLSSKMRTILALHLKINDSHTAKKNPQNPEMRNYYLDQNEPEHCDITYSDRAYFKGKAGWGLISIPSFSPSLFPPLPHATPSPPLYQWLWMVKLNGRR